MDNKLKIMPELAKWTPEQVKDLVGEGELSAVLELTLKDTATGEVKQRIVKKSESFVKNFLSCIHAMFRGVGAMEMCTVYDIIGGLAPVRSGYYNLWAGGGIGDWTFGIAVGTGTTAPTINDISWQSGIAHGVGAGQLQYSAVAIGAPTSDSVASHFTVTRDFSNASGGSITINEFILNLLMEATPGQATNRVMVIRDVLVGGIAVPNGQTLTVNYRIICSI